MYNVGDLVRVKDNAYEIKHLSITFADPMKQYCGNEYTIHRVIIRADGTARYRLKDACSDKPTVNGDGYWAFVDEWLDPVNNKEINIEENDFEDIFGIIKSRRLIS